MRTHDRLDRWPNFRTTAIKFEMRFATEEACRAYGYRPLGWNGAVCCCDSACVWEERNGTLFGCDDCGYQTLLTSGTLLEKTKKPFNARFPPISR